MSSMTKATAKKLIGMKIVNVFMEKEESKEFRSAVWHAWGIQLEGADGERKILYLSAHETDESPVVTIELEGSRQ